MTGTIQPEEIVWLLTVFPGLFLWTGNMVTAHRTYFAAKRAGIKNGRLTVAKLAAKTTMAFTLVEVAFAMAGVVYLFRSPAPEAQLWSRLFVTGLFILTSLLITNVGFMSSRVDHELLSQARARTGEADRLIRVDAAQVKRTIALDLRTIGQDDRSKKQTVRGLEQDLRGEEQDARGLEQDRNDPNTP